MKLKTLLFSLVFFLPLVSALTSGEGTILFGALFTMMMIVIFFLVLSLVSKSPPMKLFLMSLATIVLVASVGFVVSIIRDFFSEFTTLISFYSSFYVLLTILLIGGSIGLILWLLVVAVKSFWSYRGLSDDDGFPKGVDTP